MISALAELRPAGPAPMTTTFGVRPAHHAVSVSGSSNASDTSRTAVLVLSVFARFAPFFVVVDGADVVYRVVVYSEKKLGTNFALLLSMRSFLEPSEVVKSGSCFIAFQETLNLPTPS